MNEGKSNKTNQLKCYILQRLLEKMSNKVLPEERLKAMSGNITYYWL